MTALNTGYTYQDMIAELDRRSRNRQATASFLLGIVSVAIAVVAVLISAST